MIEFQVSSVTQNQNLVIVHNGGQSIGDCNDRCVVELCPQRTLYPGISSNKKKYKLTNTNRKVCFLVFLLPVHMGRGFVQY